jgi:3-deoxy-manno-octulosonate cytidylyltransferase (CMP-KDO synthetase)
MLWHVYQAASQARRVNCVYVLTDSQEVLDAAVSWGALALMTSEDCPTGTDRMASVIDAMKADIIVNVQGDEPLITGQVIDQLVNALENSTADVATPVHRIETLDELNNPNLVKVARALDGSAIYFSRSPVPHVRDVDPAEWLSHTTFWGHVGVYAYRERILREFSSLPQGQLERVEKLEQLRLLEAGRRFLAVEIDYRPQDVNVPSDLEAVRQILKRRSNGP